MSKLLSLFHIDVENLWLVGFAKASFIAIFALALLIFGKFVIVRVIRRSLQAIQNPVDENIVIALNKFYQKVVVLIAFGLIIGSLPLPAEFEAVVHNSVYVLISLFILLGIFDATNVVGRILRAKAREFEPLFVRLTKIITATIVLMIVMRHFNYDIWHIVTALGVGTLAVGLAAQPTLSNMIAGFTILIDRPFRPGDRISLTGGEIGDVVQIGMRSTRIQTTDGNLLIVSNSELVNTRVVNFSYPNNHLGNKVRFYFEHSAPLNDIKSVLKKVALQIPGIRKESVNVFSTNVTELGVEIGIFFSLEHFTESAIVTDRIIDSAITALREKNYKFATNPALGSPAKI